MASFWLVTGDGFLDLSDPLGLILVPDGRGLLSHPGSLLPATPTLGFNDDLLRRR